MTRREKVQLQNVSKKESLAKTYSVCHWKSAGLLASPIVV